MIRQIVLATLLSALAGAETLHYNINWASGLSLGEATLQSNQAGNWNFDLDMDVSVPGFAVKDKYRSSANTGFCSVRLDKTVSRGSKKSEERVTFDQQKQVAVRQTAGGGKSEVATEPCARDPFTLLQFVRKELAEGRLAAQQSIVFGAVYQVRFEYAGVQMVEIGKTQIEAERIHTTAVGPASSVKFDIFFARDASRTPLAAKIPSPLGVFVVELMR
jgi:hypothetical protein